ncbi:hypothetical protein GFL91_25115 [Rhizobium leguminosarum bv. viciae]|uniref:Uncharacterized protein n=1 Tax=Rhizobium leguminosarum bv. viciae TaxID=387 RepID=A0A8I2H273_RHILV|nr:hypothetical protein [Rhizobium leguminosarum bv. viciae]NKM48188.1 hypothetical protein [Rhizobium leguminosarum bv. viciae]
MKGNGYQQFVPRRFHRFPTIHYAIFLAKNINILATSRRWPRSSRPARIIDPAIFRVVKAG